MLRNKGSMGINPIHADRANPVRREPTRDELTAIFVRAARRLGLNADSNQVSGGLWITLFNFAQGDAHVRPDHGPALDEAAAFLAVSPWRRVWIIGNADKLESKNEQTLDWLSLKRAQRVWDQLAKRKVPKSQIIELNDQGVMGAGATISQAAPNHKDPGRFRMVEVLLMNMNVQRIIEEHKAELKARGYEV